jgi:hypothetical protein
VVGGIIDVIAKTGSARARSPFSKGFEAENGRGKLCNCSHALRKSLLRAMRLNDRALLGCLGPGFIRRQILVRRLLWRPAAHNCRWSARIRTRRRSSSRSGTPRARASWAVRACFNCHSNQTRWPWYASVALFSWVVEADVEGARSIINFSEWNRTYDLALYSGQSIRTGNMPPIKYRMAHPQADLSDQEQRELARGLDAMLRRPGAR